MRVSVFGSARPLPGDELYLQAFELGGLLAMGGHTVLTGGYGGTMEAVSWGASEGGAQVIGVTSEEIEQWRPLGANQWVQEEKRFPTLHERLFYLVDNCEAAIALPGGAGTLAEISVLWNHLIIKAMPSRPLIIIGKAWREVFRRLFDVQSQYIHARERDLLSFAEDIHQAISLLAVEKNIS
jgi:uncharacterized protein (TIGR00730 family)